MRFNHFRFTFNFFLFLAKGKSKNTLLAPSLSPSTIFSLSVGGVALPIPDQAPAITVHRSSDVIGVAVPRPPNHPPSESSCSIDLASEPSCSSGSNLSFSYQTPRRWISNPLSPLRLAFSSINFYLLSIFKRYLFDCCLEYGNVKWIGDSRLYFFFFVCCVFRRDLDYDLCDSYCIISEMWSEVQIWCFLCDCEFSFCMWYVFRW